MLHKLIIRFNSSAATRPYRSPSPHKIWQPTHGVVFNKSFSTAHQNSATMASRSGFTDEDLLLHSATEDDYLLASMTAAQLDALSKEDSAPPTDQKTPKLPAKPVETIEIIPDPAKDKIPETSYSYKMTEELFRAAKDAPPQSPESYWLHTLYRGPSSPGEEPKKVKVHYCQSLHTSERVLSQYFLNEKIVGFDIEWMADTNRHGGPKQNVSLIQIASEERIALLHIAVYAKDNVSALVAPSLKKLMEDPAITKVGVAIKGDCTRLRNHLTIHSQGLFELSHLYKLIKYSHPDTQDLKQINKKLVSLATQVQDHLHLPMFKGTDVRSSDWSKKLSMDQITYAASDSYAGIQLYNVMDLKRQALEPTPPLPFHAERDLPIRLAEGIVPVVTEDVAAEEQEEPEDTTLLSLSGKKSLSSTSKLPKSEVSLESESDSDYDSAFEYMPTPPASPKTTRSSTKSVTPKPNTPKHPLYITAEEQVSAFRARTASSTLPHRATAANLRAYFLWWSNPELSIPEIAAIIRTPALQTATVAGYILEALKLESLEYENVRVREVFNIWRTTGGGKGPAGKRYWKLEKTVELD